MASNDNVLYIGEPFGVTTGGNFPVRLDGNLVKLGGLFCSSSTAGTATLYNGQSATGTPIVPTFTMVVGQFYNLPINFPNGCFIVFGGAATGTVLYT